MTVLSESLTEILHKLVVFSVGCLVVATPFFVRAQFIHADETARHEQTMEPGITMLMGLIAAPFGGVVAVILWRWLRHRAARDDIAKVKHSVEKE